MRGAATRAPAADVSSEQRRGFEKEILNKEELCSRYSEQSSIVFKRL